MAETQIETNEAAQPESEETPNRLQAFVTKHPRAAKVVTISGGVMAAVGVFTVARTVKANRGHLENAAEHASEAASELAATVDPASPEA